MRTQASRDSTIPKTVEELAMSRPVLFTLHAEVELCGSVSTEEQVSML